MQNIDRNHISRELFGLGLQSGVQNFTRNKPISMDATEDVSEAYEDNSASKRKKVERQIAKKTNNISIINLPLSLITHITSFLNTNGRNALLQANKSLLSDIRAITKQEFSILTSDVRDLSRTYFKSNYFKNDEYENFTIFENVKIALYNYKDTAEEILYRCFELGQFHTPSFSMIRRGKLINKEIVNKVFKAICIGNPILQVEHKLILFLIKNCTDVSFFRTLPDIIRKDEEFVLKAINLNRSILEYVDDEFKLDPDIILAAIKKIKNKESTQEVFYTLAHKDLWKNREFVLEVVKIIGSFLYNACSTLQNDKAVVMAAVTQNGCALQFAHDDLRKERDVVMAAVTQHGCALQFAHDDLRKDREIVMTAITKRGDALRYAHDNLRNDREIVMAAVTQEGYALQYAHDDLRKDREIVMTAVIKYAKGRERFVLEFAHDDLRKERDVVMAAVTEEGDALQIAHDDLRKDRDVVMAAVIQRGEALRFAHDDLRKDWDVVMAAVIDDGEALKYAHDDLKKDRDVVIAAVNQKGVALGYSLCIGTRNDKVVVMVAISQDGWALKYAHDDLKKDRDVVIAAVTQKGKALKYAHDDLKKDRDVVLAALNKNPKAIEFVNFEILDVLSENDYLFKEILDYYFHPRNINKFLEYARDKKKLVKAAVSKNGLYLQYTSEDMKNDKEVVMAAAIQNIEALKFASIALQNNRVFVEECRALKVCNSFLI
ncbi:MAG: DUF4116 domain-containing protein [Parachlamydiaceae bacterium]|nr:DUF4116 domain-containing protein [Parachlamydiaceae bacterium]